MQVKEQAHLHSKRLILMHFLAGISSAVASIEASQLCTSKFAGCSLALLLQCVLELPVDQSSCKFCSWVEEGESAACCEQCSCLQQLCKSCATSNDVLISHPLMLVLLS